MSFSLILNKFCNLLIHLCYSQVADLKNKIEVGHADMTAARQKLIHCGKVLKDEELISELGISQADFIVCMITKEIAKV